jgi:DNA-binding MurR/RpiR family transcriptional regulator
MCGGSKAGKEMVAFKLGVSQSTVWRWCKEATFSDWKEVCRYYSKH